MTIKSFLRQMPSSSIKSDGAQIQKTNSITESSIQLPTSIAENNVITKNGTSSSVAGMPSSPINSESTALSQQTRITEKEQQQNEHENPQKSSPLTLLRALFENVEILEGRLPIEAYILPRTDAHNSEYLCEHDLHARFISGFSGSYAYIVVTKEKALLWTDGRYFIQAESELYEGWTLMKQTPYSLKPTEWLLQNLDAGTRIGFDPKLFDYETGTQLLQQLRNFNIQPIPIEQNLINLIWTDRPQEEIKKLTFLTVEECGEEPESKLARVRQELSKQKCDCVLISQLDDVAWLFNLRGSDIPYNPVFFSYAFVTGNDKAFLFVDLRKMSPEVAEHLRKNGVEVFEYKDASAFVKQYHEICKAGPQPEKHRIWISQATNYEMGSLVEKKHAYVSTSPVERMRIRKNEAELNGMRRCHVRDSAALLRFLYWLKNELDLEHVVDESRAVRQINYYRGQLEKFVSLSFETIGAVDEHAALPHYKASEETGKKLITKDSVFLLDSGGQYRDGTTDVTRTVCFAEQPDEYFRHMFTLVLKAHLDCALTKFPDGAYGMQLDGITRAPLWRNGYDFGHGTGHGVGHFLNVHEIPPMIGHSKKPLSFGLGKHNVVTIEPGYYEQGKFGIRIENCYELVEAKGLPSGVTNFLAFAPLTLVPIQKNLIVRELLEQKHIDWLNRYHNACLESVGRYLQENCMQEEYNFLAQACTPF